MAERAALTDISLLYVEDEVTVRANFTDFFAHRVGELFVAEDGEAGLALFEAHRPDVVISDVRMPKMDGLRMAEAIKRIDREVCIIITSAFNDQTYLLDAIETGISRYVLKPIRRELLLKALWACAEQVRLRRLEHAQTERIQKMLEIQDAIVCLSDGERIRYANPAFLDFFGVDTLEAFYVRHTCLGELFEAGAEYLAPGPDWVARIAQCAEPVRVRIHAQVFLVRCRALDETLYVLSFTDVSVIEGRRLMLEKQQLEQDRLMLHQAKMAAMGEMIGAIAHNWRQPLNTLSVQIQLMQLLQHKHELTDEAFDTRVESCLQQIQFMSRTIDDFRNFFKPAETQQGSFKIARAVDAVLVLIEAQLTSHAVRVERQIASELSLCGNVNRFEQALLNVILNAKDAVEERQGRERAFAGVVRIEARREGDRTLLVIWDNAAEVADTVLERIFDPYFTTKPPGKGTGTGMYMTHAIIVRQMGGTLRGYNENGGFAIEMGFEHRAAN